MALRFRPHTLTHQPSQPIAAGGDITGHEWPSGGTMKGQLTPLAPKAVYDKFGIEDVERPHVLLLNLEDAEHVRKDDRFEMQGRVFSVLADPKLWNAIPSTSYGEILLTEIK